jgi:hypothetical protein
LACRLTLKKRLENWFGLLAVGFCWCLVMGEQVEATAVKNHGRPAQSVFRRGLDFLQEILPILCGHFTVVDYEKAVLYLAGKSVVKVGEILK